MVLVNKWIKYLERSLFKFEASTELVFTVEMCAILYRLTPTTLEYVFYFYLQNITDSDNE
jgi:hypothetical protein